MNKLKLFYFSYFVVHGVFVLLIYETSGKKYFVSKKTYF